MWPFKKKPAGPVAPFDCRVWNEDWQIGDVAECIVDGVEFHWGNTVKPWERPTFRQQLTVCGFNEGSAKDGSKLCYFLRFHEWPIELETRGFRKVRSVKSENSEVVQQILTAKPGADRVRERT